MVLVLVSIFLSTVQTAESMGRGYFALSSQWVQNAIDEGWRIDSVDASVFQRTVDELGTYLQLQIGKENLDKVFKRVRTTYDLERALEDELEVTFSQLYPDFYAWQESRSTPGGEWVEIESEHFIFTYHSGSVAESDIALIQAVAEQSFLEVAEILGLDSLLLTRMNLVLRSDLDTTYFCGKILIRLHPTRSDLESFEILSGGQTRFGTMLFQDTLGYLLWIDLAYPGPAGLFGLPHEIAHASALLFLSDLPRLTQLLRSGGYVPADTLRSAVLPDDILRLEGWAFMAQHNYFSYVRLGLWSSTRQAMSGQDFPDPYVMLNKEAQKTPLERRLGMIALARTMSSSEISRYLLFSADLLRFLQESYGSERLRMFLSNQKPPMDALLDVYGLTPYALVQAWQNDVMER